MLLPVLSGALGFPEDLLCPLFRVSATLFFILVILVGSTMNYIALLVLVTGLAVAAVYKATIPKPSREAVESILGTGEPVIFAHRGAALDAPENTVAAIRLAKKNGAFGVELDLSFTKDGVAVAFHDDDLDRTTDGTGPLAEKNWDEIKGLNAAHGSLFEKDHENVTIPTMEEAVGEALKLGLRVVLDVKECDARTVPYLIDLFKKFPTLDKNALVASFFPQVVYSLRSENPKIVGALIWRPNFAGFLDTFKGKQRFRNNPIKQYLAEMLDPILDWAVHQVLWHLTGSSAVLITKDCISANYVTMWTDRGIRVLSWTPNLPVEKDFLLHLNVSLITDSLL